MEELDLHYINEDLDLGIASEGTLFRNMNEIISRISEVKKTVKSINLNNQYALKEIPAILGECKQLEKLNISHTSIHEIPDFVFDLPNLRHLSCCCTELASFPMGIFRLEGLEQLHIRINKDWVIPKEIPPLSKLKILALDLYSPAALPHNLGILESLEQLLIATKYAEGDAPALPSSLENHFSLKEVSIVDPFYKHRKDFNLENAAMILSSCSMLESLKLSGLAVGKGHQALSMLTGLKSLEMRHLLVEGNIFDSISALSNLEILGVWGSEFRITEIPDIFMDMKELQEFSFAGNMVMDLPPSIYDLAKLKVLEIGSTGISSLDDRIGSLQNLEKIHIYDNILEKLPDTVFTLPRLKVLNIEENIFSANEIAKIQEKLNALARNIQKVEFIYDRQGHRQMVKKLRVLKDTDSMNAGVYAKYCLNAVNENPYAIKYVNTAKLQGSRYYAELCIAAIRKTYLAFENIDPKIVGNPYYFYVCMEAAKCQDAGDAFKFIRGDLLTDNEYIQVCVEAALHNRLEDFIDNFNTEAFQKRFNREIYEHICWVAVLHTPQAVSKMVKPTAEINKLVR